MTTHTEGFSAPDNRGHITFTKHHADLFYDPPKLEGYVAYFTVRVGLEYSRWIFRPMTEHEFEKAAAKAYAIGPGRTPTKAEHDALIEHIFPDNKLYLTKHVDTEPTT